MKKHIKQTEKRSTSKVWLRRRNKRIAAGFERIMFYDFDVLERHRAFAERSIAAQTKALEEEMEEALRSVTPDYADAYRDHMYDEYINTSELLPRLQWYAQFLVVYATFEYMLNVLCKIVERRSALRFSVKDLTGLGIQRSKDYLSKGAGVQSPFNTPAWQRVVLLGDIRNAIAHRNGEVDLKDHAKLVKQLKNEKHVTLKKYIKEQDDAEIVIDGLFVRQAIVELKSVLTSVGNYELYDDEDD